jgi:3-dehydroquinate synthase
MGIMATVTVSLGERSYPIAIGSGWLDGLGAVLAEAFPPRPVTLVTNPRLVEAGWAGKAQAALEAAGYRVSLHAIPGGEDHKTIDTVTAIHDHMLEAKATRQSGVVALGGGIVGDVAGFAAASLLRGVAYIQIPTTLLAMVDSSVGGKTGVNHRMGKNLIGAFWQPSFVGIELETLATLPDAELRAGMAEVIKYGVIADAALFDYLEANMDRALARDPEVLAHLIRRSCEIKADVVARDEREGGLRAILNYGHTFGHAAEALGEFTAIRHGEGVAMGMVAAARLAQARGLIGPEVGDRVERLCERACLPTRLSRFAPDAYWAKMGSDKKARDGKIRFVLPEAMGRVGVYDDVSPHEVERCVTRGVNSDQLVAAIEAATRMANVVAAQATRARDSDNAEPTTQTPTAKVIEIRSKDEASAEFLKLAKLDFQRGARDKALEIRSSESRELLKWFASNLVKLDMDDIQSFLNDYQADIKEDDDLPENIFARPRISGEAKGSLQERLLNNTLRHLNTMLREDKTPSGAAKPTSSPASPGNANNKSGAA